LSQLTPSLAACGCVFWDESDTFLGALRRILA